MYDVRWDPLAQIAAFEISPVGVELEIQLFSEIEDIKINFAQF
jgi:hypothetical protein